MEIKSSDFINKEEIEKDKVFEEFSELIEISKKHGIEIADKKNDSKKLLIDDKKTYELLGIKDPKIDVIWEKFNDLSYYRCIIMKDNEKEKVLAFSKTNLNNIDEKSKNDIFAKNMPIGVLINKNEIAEKRVVYLAFKVKIEEKTKDARAYVIKDSKNNILFNIFEIFL